MSEKEEVTCFWEASSQPPGASPAPLPSLPPSISMLTLLFLSTVKAVVALDGRSGGLLSGLVSMVAEEGEEKTGEEWSRWLL